MRTLHFRALFFIVTTLLLVSCEKKEVMEVDNENQSIIDYAIIDQEFMSILPALMQHMAVTPGTGSQDQKYYTCEPLAYVSGDTNSFIPNPVFSLDLSKTSCSLPDGKVRTGKLFVRLNGKFKNNATECVIKFQNYKVGDLSFKCDSLLAINSGTNPSYTLFNIKLIKGVCEGTSYRISYTSDKMQAVYAINDGKSAVPVASNYGTSSGINRTGLAFSANTTTDLVKQNNCPYFEKGILFITPKGFKERKIDFGTGTCDELATFAVNENTVSFKLK